MSISERTSKEEGYSTSVSTRLMACRDPDRRRRYLEFREGKSLGMLKLSSFGLTDCPERAPGPCRAGWEGAWLGRYLATAESGRNFCPVLH